MAKIDKFDRRFACIWNWNLDGLAVGIGLMQPFFGYKWLLYIDILVVSIRFQWGPYGNHN